MSHLQRAAATALLLLSPAFLHAGPTGGAHENQELWDFLNGYLYGPRTDVYWDEDWEIRDLPGLDQRIEVLQVFLGDASYPLAQLREYLSHGMYRTEYEQAARTVMDDLKSRIFEYDSPPRLYRGSCDGDDFRVALRWLDSRAVIGLFYFSPREEQGADRYYMLEGHNRSQGKLYFEEYTGRTQSATFHFVKRNTYDKVNWVGYRKGTDDRIEEAYFSRLRR